MLTPEYCVTNVLTIQSLIRTSLHDLPAEEVVACGVDPVAALGDWQEVDEGLPVVDGGVQAHAVVHAVALVASD